METTTPSFSPPHEREKIKRKILIIGSKGTLGQTLASEFSEGNKLFLWDRDEVNLVEINPSTISGQKIRNLGPDLIINAAAYNDVDQAEQEPEIANSVNGYAVGYLAAISKELNIPIVHYSTDYVFDGEKKEGYVESDQPNPLSAYGKSKHLGEQELQKNTEKFYLIRLSRLFGKSSAAGKKGFVDLMLELAKTKKEIEVVDEELSSPTYAPDLARLTRQIIDSEFPYGIYHGANSGVATWFGFAAETFKIAKLNVKLVPVAQDRFKRAAQRPKYSILLNIKLSAQRSWQEALREFLISNFSAQGGSASGGQFSKK